MKTISDLSERKRHLARVRDSITLEFDWRSDWLRQSAWVVVPVESGLHFVASDMRLVSRLAKACGTARLAAVPLEPQDGPVPVFELGPTQKDLLEFNVCAFDQEYVLVGSKWEFGVLCRIHEFYLLAGPRSVLDSCLEGGIRGALDEFRAFAEDKNCDPWTRELHMYIALKYCQHG